MRLRHIALSFALLLSACATPAAPWTKAGVSDEQAAADFLACRRWADREVAPAYENVDSDLNAVRRQDREHQKQKVGALASECMAMRGYAPAKKHP